MAKTTELGAIKEIAPSAWELLLRAFHAIIADQPSTESVKEGLLALKTQAKNTGSLTYRQVEGIVDRCDNYLNGTYGRDAIKEAYQKTQA